MAAYELTTSTHAIICPYCGHAERDDLGTIEDGDSPHICEADACERSFLLRVETVTTYTAIPMEELPPVLTMLPCGGLGELDPTEKAGMRIVCSTHRVWERDQHGRVKTELTKGELRYVFRDTPGCGAITDAADGVRRIVGFVRAQEQAA